MIISVVIPVYSGADHLVALNEALARERQRWQTEGAPFELGEAIFVDDASIDSSSEVLRDLDEKYDWIRVVTLARNFGQHPATIAGILHTSGDWVVTLDEDLQHDPAAIQSLLKIAAETNADIVYARPDGSVHGGYRDVASRMYKRLMVTLTRKTEVASFNSFRLLRGSVARAAASVSGHETYYDIALGWFTDRFESVELPMTDSRYASSAQSGYSFSKLLSHARRLVISSQTKALRATALVGLLGVAVAMVFATRALIIQTLSSSQVEGWTSLFAAILFFGGITSLILAVIVEYLTNVVLHLHGKPTFFAIDRSSDTELAEWFGESDAPTPT